MITELSPNDTQHYACDGCGRDMIDRFGRDDQVPYECPSCEADFERLRRHPGKLRFEDDSAGNFETLLL